MLTLMLTFFVFVAGFLAAYVDWDKFLKEFVHDMKTMENKTQVIFSFFVILLSFFVCMYKPISMVVEISSNRYREQMEKSHKERGVIHKPVSYR